MAHRFHVRKGDKVMVITGQHKGKEGEILRIFSEEHRAIVQGINVVKRHLRPTPENPDGVMEKELSIHLSNLAHKDPESGKPTRIGSKVLNDGTKARIAKRSGKQLDS